VLIANARYTVSLCCFTNICIQSNEDHNTDMNQPPMEPPVEVPQPPVGPVESIESRLLRGIWQVISSLNDPSLATVNTLGGIYTMPVHLVIILMKYSIYLMNIECS